MAVSVSSTCHDVIPMGGGTSVSKGAPVHRGGMGVSLGSTIIWSICVKDRKVVAVIGEVESLAVLLKVTVAYSQFGASQFTGGGSVCRTYSAEL